MPNQYICDLNPYVPGKPISELARDFKLDPAKIIKLASNENPCEISPVVKNAIITALPDIARYPDGDAFALKEQLSLKYNISRNRITIGNGSNDVLDMIARALLNPDSSAVFSQHAFAVYPISTQLTGARSIITPAINYGHDLTAMGQALADDTKLVWIANPNNPTGTWLKQDELYGFLQNLPKNIWVVVDEAYFEYVTQDEYPDCAQWIDEFPNLIVTRTFSKAYGLAGLRVGYALSSAYFADILNRVRQPFNVNSLAQVAAMAVLAEVDYLSESIRINNEGREQLEQFFGANGIEYIPSVGNFITIITKTSVDELYTKLLHQGVIVRPVENYGIDGGVRISIGTAVENNKFMDAILKMRII